MLGIRIIQFLYWRAIFFKCILTKLLLRTYLFIFAHKKQDGYSNSDMTMIYFILDRFQISKMREIVHSVDENAYIIISEDADVFKANM